MCACLSNPYGIRSSFTSAYPNFESPPPRPAPLTPLLASTMIPCGSISFSASSGASGVSVAAGITARIGDPRLALDLVRPDVRQAVRPAVDVAMIAADIDDLRRSRHVRRALLSIPPSAAMRTAHRAPAELAGSHFWITSSANFPDDAGNRSPSFCPADDSPAT